MSAAAQYDAQVPFQWVDRNFGKKDPAWYERKDVMDVVGCVAFAGLAYLASISSSYTYTATLIVTASFYLQAITAVALLCLGLYCMFNEYNNDPAVLNDKARALCASLLAQEANFKDMSDAFQKVAFQDHITKEDYNKLLENDLRRGCKHFIERHGVLGIKVLNPVNFNLIKTTFLESLEGINDIKDDVVAALGFEKEKVIKDVLALQLQKLKNGSICFTAFATNNNDFEKHLTQMELESLQKIAFEKLNIYKDFTPMSISPAWSFLKFTIEKGVELLHAKHAEQIAEPNFKFTYFVIRNGTPYLTSLVELHPELKAPLKAAYLKSFPQYIKETHVEFAFLGVEPEDLFFLRVDKDIDTLKGLPSYYPIFKQRQNNYFEVIPQNSPHYQTIKEAFLKFVDPLSWKDVQKNYGREVEYFKLIKKNDKAASS